MATLSIPGLGSNLPIDTLITGLMNVEKQPLTQLDAKTTTYQNQLSALGQVQGSLASFQAAAISLQNSSNFSSTQAASSLNDVASISVNDKAAAGSYALSVQSLAQNQKLATSAFSSATSVIGGGTLTFNFGSSTFDANNKISGFTPNATKTPQTVTIPANATLNDVRDAVNAAKIGVTASVVNDGTGYRLVYSSSDTGTNNSLEITTSDSTLSALSNDPASNKLTVVQSAQDAKFTLDGISITKSSNTVSDAIDGLTITLKKAQATGDAPAQLTVSKNTSGISSTLNAFVSAYNSLNKVLTSVSAVDTSTTVKPGTLRNAAPLNGDSIIRSIKTQIRNVFNTVQDVGGAFRVPAEVGLGFDKNGNMTLDSTKLQKAIDTNPQDIAKLFGAVGTPTDAQVNYVSSTGKTTAGNYAVNVTGLQHGVLASGAAVPASLTVAATAPATGQSFQVNIDGTLSGMLTLPNGTYTPSSLATALQGAINADSTLSAAGAQVSVSVDRTSGKLLISSNKTTSASTVQIVSGLSNVGGNSLFADGVSGTPGQAAVSGTIGGYAALGDGNTLTGAIGTPVEGLKISVDGGNTGDRGSISLTRGFGFALDSALSGMLDSKNGLIAAKTTGINSSIKQVADQRDALNRRLTVIEANYRSQFNALDTLVSQLTNTGNFLTQQLSSLSSSSFSSKN